MDFYQGIITGMKDLNNLKAIFATPVAVIYCFLDSIQDKICICGHMLMI